MSLIDLVTASLEKDGTLQSIRSKLKASVLSTLSNHYTGKENQVVLSHQLSVREDDRSTVSLSLVADLLTTMGLGKTYGALRIELGNDKSSIDRSNMIKALGLRDIQGEPLLFQLLGNENRTTQSLNITAKGAISTPSPPTKGNLPPSRSFGSPRPSSPNYSGAPEENEVSFEVVPVPSAKISPKHSSANILSHQEMSAPISSNTPEESFESVSPEKNIYIEESPKTASVLEDSFNSVSSPRGRPSPRSASSVSPKAEVNLSPQASSVVDESFESYVSEPISTPTLKKSTPINDLKNLNDEAHHTLNKLETSSLSPAGLNKDEYNSSKENSPVSKQASSPSLVVEVEAELTLAQTNPTTSTTLDKYTNFQNVLDSEEFKVKSGVSVTITKNLSSLAPLKPLGSSDGIDKQFDKHSMNEHPLPDESFISSNEVESLKEYDVPEDNDIPDESFMSVEGSISSDIENSDQSSPSAISRREDKEVDVARVRRVTVNEAKNNSPEAVVSRANIRRVGTSSMLRSTVGWNVSRSPDRDEYDVDDYNEDSESPVQRTMPGTRRSNIRLNSPYEHSFESVEENVSLGSDQIDLEQSGQSRQSSNQDDDSDANIKHTLPMNPAELTTKSVWGNTRNVSIEDQSIGDSDVAGATESFDGDEDGFDDDDDDDDSLPLPIDDEAKHLQTQGGNMFLSRTKSGALLPVQSSAAHDSADESGDGISLAEDIEEEEYEEEYADNTPIIASQKPLPLPEGFTRIEAKPKLSVPVEVNDDDEYLEEFEEEENGNDVSAYQHPGDTDELDEYSIGEESDLEEFDGSEGF